MSTNIQKWCWRLGRMLGAAAALLIPISPVAGGPAHQKAQVLHRFSGGRSGGNPYGPLLTDATGNLFGTTEFGGKGKAGVAFELSPADQAPWPEHVLHTFEDADGAYPVGGLTADATGNLFGATFSAGYDGGGTVFELSPNGHKWNYTVLYGFGNADSTTGSNPNGGLVFDAAGNIYGTTQLGGSVVCTHTIGPCGVVFELSPGENGTWTETVLYNFRGPPDGAYPYSPILLDAAGNLYGATSEGGSGKCNDGEGTVTGCGTVFELSNSGGAWNETILYNFTKNEENGPASPLVFDTKGSIYGTAGYDVFRLDQSAGEWSKSTILEFTEGIAGTIPSSGVVFDGRGNLYGTTASSGLEGFSTAFELFPPDGGDGAWTLATLSRFGKSFDSNQPRGGILIGNSGILYGAASGTAEHGYVFSISK